jgi:hypothetical protein
VSPNLSCESLSVAGKSFPSEHWYVRSTGQIEKKPL